MDALDLLTTRRSVRELTAPAPDELELETIFQSATQVPDHGGLTPWRFVRDPTATQPKRVSAAPLKKPSSK